MKKTQRILKKIPLIMLFTLCISLFSKTYVLGDSEYEQRKIIYDLQNSVKKCGFFWGCTYGYVPEDFNTRYPLITPLRAKLHDELAPEKLFLFYQFKERINVVRQHAIYTKDQADYCLVYDFSERIKATPTWWQKNTRLRHQENVESCNTYYNKFCFDIDNLESQINSDFLRYYTLKPPIYWKNIYDYGLVQLANGNVEIAVILADEFLNEVKKKNDLKSLSAEQFLNLGITFVEAMEYSKAIDYLNQSIEKDPTNKEAYFQRAIANLEIGILDNAVIDFLASEKSKDLKPINSTVPNEFKDAFLQGLSEGTTEAIINFFPSLYSFAYGNVFHPIDSIGNYVSACYELMKIEAEYFKEVVQTQLDEPSYDGLSMMVLKPGLKRLFEKMEELSPAEQGQLLGHTIGAYGTDFVAGIGLVKGISNCAKLANACKVARDVGRIYELETLVESAGSIESIIPQVAERAAIRETIVQGAKSGRVVIKNPNVQFHVMQEKHAWDKLIQVSGNTEEDFRKVVLLLEENNVLSEKYIFDTQEFSQGKIIRKDYKITIEGQEIQAAFETYVKDNQTFLKDAWIITK